MTYLVPTSTNTYPNGVTLTQFIQTILVGLSGLPSNMVRPKFQINPPKQPQINENWIAFAIMSEKPDDYGNFVTSQDGLSSTFSQQQTLSIQTSFYGPQARGLTTQVRTGFYIPQNREVMSANDLGFTGTGPILFVPDLVNERFVERFEMEIQLRMKIRETYNVLSLLSAQGSIIVDDPPIQINFET